jgi:hypothetical protein
MNDPKGGDDPERAIDFSDPTFRQVFSEQWLGPEHRDLAGMNKHEEEEFLLHYGPRKERKALKKRLKAAKRAKNAKGKLDRTAPPRPI